MGRTLIVSIPRQESAIAANRGWAVEVDGRRSGRAGRTGGPPSAPRPRSDWSASRGPRTPEAAGPRAQLEVEPGLARPHEGGRLPATALDRPAAAERGLEGEEPPADLFDQPARGAEVDRPLPAFFAVDQPIIRPIGPRPAAAPRGRDRSLPREQVRPGRQQGHGGMRVLVSAFRFSNCVLLSAPFIRARQARNRSQGRKQRASVHPRREAGDCLGLPAGSWAWFSCPP